MYGIIAASSILSAAAELYLFGRIEQRIKGFYKRNRRTDILLFIIILILFFAANVYSVEIGLVLHKLLVINIILFAAVLSAYEDFKYKQIEDEIQIFTFAAGLLAYLFNGFEIKSRIWGFVLGGGILLIIAVLSRGGMGGADIKLMAVYGMMIGPKYTLLALLIGFTAGAASSIVLLILRLKGKKDMIPFSPFLSIGTITAYLFGDALIEMYLRMLLI